MSSTEPLDEEKSIRLRQRLWGAAVLIALLVIFLPLVLDGSGSESQYRRVERLRQEPPRVIDAEGNREAVEVIEELDVNLKVPAEPLATAPVVNEVAVENEAVISQPEAVIPEPAQAPVKSETLQAWVIQAGSYQEEANAIAIRDKLRRAGFPSFVTPTDSATPLFRVRVGPMISMQRAEISKNKVMRLLDIEAIIVGYP